MSESVVTISVTDDQYALIRSAMYQISNGYHFSNGYRDEYPSSTTIDIANSALCNLSFKPENQDIFFSRDIKADIVDKFVKIKVYDDRTTINYDGQVTELKSYEKGEDKLFDVVMGNHTVEGLLEHQLVQIFYGIEVRLNRNRA